MNDDALVLLAPHLHRRGQEVFFLIEDVSLVRLANEEVAWFDALAGGLTVANLRSMHALEFATKLCERGMAIACQPIVEQSDRHVLIIEPHMDDAVLSTAGQMLRRRATERMTLLTVVRWSESTKYDPTSHPSFDRETVSNLRLAETLLAGRFAGYRHEMLDALDFPIRLRSEHSGVRTWPDLPLMEAAKRFAPAPAEIASLSAALFRRVEALAPDELWIPLGLGENPDHVLTARACLRMLNERQAYFGERRVLLYEDLSMLPPMAGHAERIVAVHARTGQLRAIEEDITDVFADKLRAIALFSSQIDMGASPWRMPNLTALTTRGAMAPSGSGRKVEMMYEVEQTPRVPAYGEIAFRSVDLAAATNALATWVRRRQAMKRVLIFNTTSFGKWELGLAVLRRTFPNAAVEVHAPEPHLWELGASPEVESQETRAGELRALLDGLSDSNVLVLVIGSASLVAANDIAERRCVVVPAFGDAVMALCDLAP